LSVLALGLVSIPAIAQDDPFGAPAARPAAGAAPASGAQRPVPDLRSLLPSLEHDPIVRSFRALPPKSPEDYGRGLVQLFRIGRWDVIQEWLNELQAAPWSPAQKAALFRAGQADVWLRMSGGDSPLPADQRMWLSGLTELAAEQASSPARLRETISRIASDSPVQRQRAANELLTAGETGTVELVQMVASGQIELPPDYVAELLRASPEPAYAAVRAVMQSADHQVRGRMLPLLPRLPKEVTLPELVAEALQTDGSPLSATASSLLTRMGQPVSEHPAARLLWLGQQLESEVSEAQRQRLLPASSPPDSFVWEVPAVATWRWNDQEQSLEQAPLPPDLARYARALELAKLWLRADGFQGRQAPLAMALVLEEAFRRQNGLLVTEPLDGLNPWLVGESADELPSTLLSAAWDVADRQHWLGASLRLTQALGIITGAESSAAAGARQRLESALLAPHPAVRSTAVVALAENQLSGDGPVSSRWTDGLIEMLSWQAQPVALVVGRDPLLRQRAVDTLASAQISSLAVSSAKQALGMLDASAPIEMVLLVDQVSDMKLGPLVERVRQYPRAASLPIGIIDGLDVSGVTNSSGIAHLSWVGQAAGQEQRWLGPLKNVATLWLEPADRLYLAALAGRMLSQLASSQQAAARAGLHRCEEQLVALMSNPLLASEAIDAVTALATPRSQRELLNLVCETYQPEMIRRRAAQRFDRSVQQYGVKLNGQDILAQYQRYNLQGPSDPLLAELLGTALDTIESVTLPVGESDRS